MYENVYEPNTQSMFPPPSEKYNPSFKADIPSQLNYSQIIPYSYDGYFQIWDDNGATPGHCNAGNNTQALVLQNQN